jgi:hypothetical protein
MFEYKISEGGEYREILSVLMSARPEDVEEIRASLGIFHPTGLALRCRHIDLRWTLFGHKAGVFYFPLAVLGAAEEDGGRYRLFMFGRPEMERVPDRVMYAFGMTVVRFLYEKGVTRAVAYSLKTHTKAHRFIDHMGGFLEVEIEGYGANGETFYQFGWCRDSVERVLRKARGRRSGESGSP